MFRKARRAAVIILVLLLPLLIKWGYEKATAYPHAIVIAGGPKNGRYELLASALASEIEARLGIHAEVRPSEGSYENMALLQQGDADLILYQHGTIDLFANGPVAPAGAHAIGGGNPGGGGNRQPHAAFVANLYSEVTHFLVHRDVPVAGPLDLPGLRVAVGQPMSGDSAISRLVLSHFGINLHQIDARQLTYGQIETAFRKGKLDAAFITVGLGAPVIRRLLPRVGDKQDSFCDLLGIPHAEAMASEYLSVSRVDVPAGLYRSREPVEPPETIETIAVRAQLLARPDLHAGLVEETVRILLDESFQQRAGLQELFANGAAFARERPEFAPHRGAVNVYEPRLKPLLDTDFVEATEGMRSFVVSVLIAAWLLVRWWRDRTRRRTEHKLDRFVREILDIERRQLDFDQVSGRDDAAALQQLLDEVTTLRQDAFKEFTTHEINEDRAIETFITLCHALSDKINAKLTRQRIEATLKPLAPTQEPPV